MSTYITHEFDYSDYERQTESGPYSKFELTNSLKDAILRCPDRNMLQDAARVMQLFDWRGKPRADITTLMRWFENRADASGYERVLEELGRIFIDSNMYYYDGQFFIYEGGNYVGQ